MTTFEVEMENSHWEVEANINGEFSKQTRMSERTVPDIRIQDYTFLSGDESDEFDEENARQQIFDEVKSDEKPADAYMPPPLEERF